VCAGTATASLGTALAQQWLQRAHIPSWWRETPLDRIGAALNHARDAKSFRHDYLTLRYLGTEDVARLLPPVAEQLDIVGAMFGSRRQMGIHAPTVRALAPRRTGFAQAMPTYDEVLDLACVKWVGGDERNAARGLPYLGGLIILNDSDTGLPAAIMDCGAITAARTAAVSGTCIAAFAAEGWQRAAFVGYGVQARAHVEVLRTLNPDVEIVVATRARSRCSAEADGLACTDTPREAIAGAEVVITGIPLSSRLDPPVSAEWIADGALVLPLDDDAALDSSAANLARRLLVDEPDRYLLERDAGLFAGWRDPDGSVLEVLAAAPPQPDRSAGSGYIVCLNQGLGAFDVPLAQAVLAAAQDTQAGVMLAR
jgi:ornithine cyclodeaminase/alanine dehydrogenase-like protein (mu-crystallin family)